MTRKHLHQEKLYTENVHDLAYLSLWNAQETLIHGKAWYWTYATKEVTERTWIKKITASAKLGRIILNGKNSLEQTVAVTVYNPKSSGSKNDLSNAEEERYWNYITKRVYIRATDLDLQICYEMRDTDTRGRTPPSWIHWCGWMLDLEPSNPEDLVEVYNERINAANRCHRAGTTLET